MSLAAGGIGSGLDVAGLVGRLVSLEQQRFLPKASLQAEYRSRISLYGGLKSSLSSLQSAIDSLRESGAPKQNTTVTNGDGVLTATLEQGTIGTFYARVDQVARNQIVQTNNFQAAITGGSANDTLTITLPGLTDPEITNAVTINFDEADTIEDGETADNRVSMSDIKATFEKKLEANPDLASRIRFTVVQDPNAPSQEKLIIENTRTGAAEEFVIEGNLSGSPGGVFAGFSADPNGAVDPSMRISQIAQDSVVQFLDQNGDPLGAAVQSATTSVSNGFGLTVNVSTASPDTVTITGSFGVDQSGLKDKIDGFVAAYNKTITALKNNQEKGSKLGRETLATRIEQSIRNELNTVLNIDGV
ncbi:MAG: flagellar filament capping protein FliD, partial [Limnobacter sp.]|nr:flagellar filament capping protein FliD [Limnobacter sp.]